MLRDCIRGAVHRARFGILAEDGGSYGEIPGFTGVFGQAHTFEAWRGELEEWLLSRVSRHLEVPQASGIDLRAPQAVEGRRRAAAARRRRSPPGRRLRFRAAS